MQALKPNNLGVIYDTFTPNAVLANGATKYVELPVRKGTLGLFTAWADATSSATITLESTNDMKADVDAAAGKLWAPEPSVTITGPSASAIGCSMKHLGNQGAARLRLKIVAAADCRLQVTANYNEA